MKRGEKNVLLAIAGIVILFMGINAYQQSQQSDHAKEIPFYSTADANLKARAGAIYKQQDCKACHSLWAVRDMMQFVPAPALDGIGSLRDEQWLYNYLTAENPQSILPSRLKPEYRMPSFSQLDESDRRILAKYLASLKVRDWYLEETRAAECKKLTGEDC